MKVSVVMATYNGERFIREQLESLASQSLLPWELVISDDGSSDMTNHIITDFSENAPFPVIHQINEVKLGYAENFLAAATRCTGDWVAFCDQDDVWNSKKLACVSSELHRRDVTLVFHAAMITDECLRPSGGIVPGWLPREKYTPRLGHDPLWMAHGFCCVVQAKVIKEVPWARRVPPIGQSEPLAHDTWVCMISNALGGTCFVPSTLAYYRRHQNTAGEEVKRRNNSPRARKLPRIIDVGEKGYKRISDLIRGRAELLFQVAAETTSPKIKSDLIEAASCYTNVADRLWERALLYKPGSTLGFRLRQLRVLLSRDAYRRRERGGIGGRALYKDLVTCLIGSRNQAGGKI